MKIKKRIEEWNNDNNEKMMMMITYLETMNEKQIIIYRYIRYTCSFCLLVYIKQEDEKKKNNRKGRWVKKKKKTRRDRQRK